ncbi:MAG: Gfo/Idh/MocA family protein [Candidatus Hydrogenedentota bacterium]
MTYLTRRSFLKRINAGAMTAAAPLILPSGVLATPGNAGANDRIVLGGIGMGVMGGNLRRAFSRLDDVRIAAVADVDLRKANAAAEEVGADAYQDYRELLDRQDIDAVFIATPHHWHALQTIHAAQAGKDIYCEKCLSHTIREGRLMADTVTKHNRVLQTGMQQRSGEEEHRGCMLIRNGRLGKIEKVIAHHYLSPWLNGLPGEPVPPELDWDMWCGPVQPHPYNPLLTADTGGATYGGWYSTRAFGGGEMTCFGPHGLDIVQRALGMDDAGPVEVWTEGEPFVSTTYRPDTFPDEPCTQCHTSLQGLEPKICMRYPGDVTVEFAEDINTGARFIGEEGSITIRRGHVSSEPVELAEEPLEEREVELYRSGDHHRNWLDCIKDRSQPVADVETGHRSATVCHLANIARWVSEVTGETGNRLQWDTEAEAFTNSDWGNHFLDRPRRASYQLPAPPPG